MARRPLAVLLALLASSVALAGCFGGDDAPAADVEPTPANETNTSSTELPTGQTFVAVEETNKTEEGVGGMDHKHDYWHGQETVTIYDQEVAPSYFPVFERNDNSKVWIAFVNLDKVPGEEDRDALVFEGTGVVKFTLTSGPAWADSWQLTFRTAGQDWTSPQPIKVGETFEYVPSKTETDMPHSFRSLWNWKLQATGPVPVSSDPAGVAEAAGAPLHVTIVVEKSNAIEDWPGHPAFYDGVHERVVMDNKQGKTTVQQAADVLIYGVEPDQLVPDKLVSMGTHTLDVYVNITRLALPPGVESDGFYLFWRHAATPPDDLGEGLMNNETDGKTWARFHVQLDPDWLDSPYQPGSRYSFKILVAPANSDAIICYRCVPYEVDYTMTVIARPHPDGTGTTMDM